MKIAVITDNSETISSHFGRAQYYDVFTIKDDQIIAKETRPKAGHSHFAKEHLVHQQEQGHGTDPASQHRHNIMIEPIRDCDIVIAGGMGLGAYQGLTANGIRPIVTDKSDIKEALNSYLAGTLADHPERLH